MTEKELEKAYETGKEQYNDLVEENNKLNEAIIELQQENELLKTNCDITEKKLEHCVKSFEKQKEILDILKPSVTIKYAETFKEYLIGTSWYINKITKEQYELLKEWLKK